MAQTKIRPEQAKLDEHWDFGAGADYLRVSGAGVITMAGTSKRALTLRPDINIDEIKKQAVPDQVQVGLFFGYSLPVYAADNEELYFRQVVPARWDGSSDLECHLMVCLAGAEDIGDRFQIQFSWNQVAGASDVVPVATHDVPVEQIVLAGRAAQYATYTMVFTLDYDVDVGDPIAAHDILAARVRRIAATVDEVDNEIIVLCWHDHFQVDKMFQVP